MPWGFGLVLDSFGRPYADGDKMAGLGKSKRKKEIELEREREREREREIPDFQKRERKRCGLVA